MPTVNIRAVSDKPLYEYFQLPETARPAARQSIIDSDKAEICRAMTAARELSKSNINAAVNDKYHISRILRRTQHFKTLTDVVKLERYIDANLCKFLIDGTYVRYWGNE